MPRWPKVGSLSTIKSLADSQVCWTQRDGVKVQRDSESWRCSGGYAGNQFDGVSMTRLTSGGLGQASLGYQCGVGPDPWIEECKPQCQTVAKAGITPKRGEPGR